MRFLYKEKFIGVGSQNVQLITVPAGPNFAYLLAGVDKIDLVGYGRAFRQRRGPRVCAEMLLTKPFMANIVTNTNRAEFKSIFFILFSPFLFLSAVLLDRQREASTDGSSSLRPHLNKKAASFGRGA